VVRVTASNRSFGEDGADSVADERWLSATWPFVRAHLPAAPARVVELGCGPLGGFVPQMRLLGYEAIGVDPQAPEAPDYEQTEFERVAVTEPLDALVACVSLHHVADLDIVLDRITSVLTPGGTVVVVEWAHERFDEATARWCFDRLAAGEGGWLSHHRDRWRASGLSWDRYFQGWVSDERLHAGRDIVRSLRARFDTKIVGEGSYLFADLGDVNGDDEQAAIDAGVIQATGIRYVGRRRARPA
jgi:SAM-dependent methyltransferase